MYCTSHLQGSTCLGDIHSVILCFSIVYCSEIGGAAVCLGLYDISAGAIVMTFRHGVA